MSFKIDLDLKITRKNATEAYGDAHATITGKDAFIEYVRCEWTSTNYNMSLSDPKQHVKVSRDSSGYFKADAIQRITPTSAGGKGYLKVTVEMRDQNYKILDRSDYKEVSYDFDFS